MLLRLIADNITSFNESVEFNTFPSSKSHNHENHKVECGHATALRLSAIYGANGAGKSNLIKVLGALKELVINGTLNGLGFIDELTFKFNKDCSDKPSGLAVEFYQNNTLYYYHIEFNRQEVIFEELLLSKKTKDVEIFSRKESKITVNGDFFVKGLNEQFIDALDRLIRPDMLLLTFLGKYYPNEIPTASDAFKWFGDTLLIVKPGASTGVVPYLFDKDPSFADTVNRIMPELNTGIDRLRIKKEILNEDEIKGNNALLTIVNQAKQHPGKPQIVVSHYGNEISNIIYEDGAIYLKSLVAVHINMDGIEVEMPLRNESDGTCRLIEYMPVLYAITRNNHVFVVDEIERSIHPIMIKDIVRKLSESETAKGQLIFTAHESGLLDQNIFRPDEIWFAQKDVEQATQLYPLSDFNIHKTANIENGYLNGRYGGIPFLSNLKDLHW